MKGKRIFGLIGYPLSHSFSKQYFTEKFNKDALRDAVYELFPLQNIKELPQLLSKYPAITGLNVTIPYKQTVIPYLDELNAVAEATGAVNTIHIKKGRLIGYNTDVAGFWLSFQKIHQPYQKRSLILGTGGASRAVSYVFQQLEVPHLFVSRNPKGNGVISYNDLNKEILNDHQIIVNTTPLGMAPDIDSLPPIPYHYLTPDHLLYDLIYNPEETGFLQEGKRKGAHIKNGLEMLHIQAEKAWEIWNANSPQAGPAQAI